MSVDFDEAIKELQESIMEEARKVYPEKVIEAWLNPRYMGEMENPQGCGEVKGPCGDTVKIFLRIDDDKITDARFTTDGCGATVAVGSMACELAIGRDIKEAFEISNEEILDNLGGLPPESIHCARLASDAVKEALTNYLTTKKAPWKEPIKTKQGEKTEYTSS
jgi:nitrogen fixation NifU-like protein